MSDPFTQYVRVRFAPSPTGWMHIGSIWLVMFNYLWARKNKGSFILRIEDTDAKRTVEKGVEAILETFVAFGIDVDEGPSVGGEYGPYVQSQRLDTYKTYAEELIDKDSAYYCFCSEDRLEQLRMAQTERKEQPMYDRACRSIPVDEARKRIAKGEKAVVRLKVPLTGVTEYDDVVHGRITFKNSVIDDQILLKSDGFPTYHFGVVVDDHLMKISHVLRGVEYVSSAPKVVLLYKALGWKMPYLVQTPSILNPDGKKKLSKRDGDNAAVKFLRKGYLVEALWNFLMLIGWAPSGPDSKPDEVYSRDELMRLFDLRRVRRSGARFMTEKLDHFNGWYIRHLTIPELADRIIEWGEHFVLHEFISDAIIGLKEWEKALIEDVRFLLPQWKEDRKKLESILSLVQQRITTLSDVPSMIRFFYCDDPQCDPDSLCSCSIEDPGRVLEELWERLQPVARDGCDQERWERTIRKYADEIGCKHADLFMLLRIAVTGSRVSPPLRESMEIQGFSRCDDSIKKILKLLHEQS